MCPAQKMEISVIIPVYNAGEFVSQAVKSALEQPETSEVLLIEDGSSDNSLDVCVSLAEKYSKVKLLQHADGENRGAAASRNLGIKSAAYSFVAFLDADDYFLPKRFSKTMDVFNSNNHVDGVYEAIGAIFMDNEVKEFWSRLPFNEVTTVKKVIRPEDLFVELISGGAGYFSFDGFTARKSLFFRVSFFNEKLIICEDAELMYKLCAKGKLYPGNIEKLVAMRRVHDNNRITCHLADKRKAYGSFIKVLQSLHEWGKHNLTKEQHKLFLHYYISHVRKIDYFDDFRWLDYFISRKKMCHLSIDAPMLLIEKYFWRRLIPSRGLFTAGTGKQRLDIKR